LLKYLPIKVPYIPDFATTKKYRHLIFVTKNQVAAKVFLKRVREKLFFQKMFFPQFPLTSPQRVFRERKQKL